MDGAGHESEEVEKTARASKATVQSGSRSGGRSSSIKSPGQTTVKHGVVLRTYA